MADEADETLDSLNETMDDEQEEILDESDTDTNDSTQDDAANDKSEVDRLKEQNKKLFDRAKKAEGFKKVDGKWVKPQTSAEEPKPEPPSTNTDTLSREEAILIAQGMEAEDLDELKDVAKAKGIPLLKAKETPLFQAYLEKKADDAKKEKAKLGSSKGSQVQQEQQIGDLTRDEHQKLSQEMMSKVR